MVRTVPRKLSVCSVFAILTSFLYKTATTAVRLGIIFLQPAFWRAAPALLFAEFYNIIYSDDTMRRRADC